MDALANQLGRVPDIGRPVINETNLPGMFDYEVSFAPASASAEPVQDRVSLFTALREQLGITLRPARAPVRVLVIESVSRPTPD